MKYTPGGVSGTLGKTLILEVSVKGAPVAPGGGGGGGQRSQPSAAGPSGGSPPGEPQPGGAQPSGDPPASSDYGPCVPAGKQLHPLRRKVIDIARSQVGLVNDLPGPEKKGWERIAEYQKIAFPNCTSDPNNWRPSEPHPQTKPWTGRNFHWCGVFCTWALIQAGVTTRTWCCQNKGEGLQGVFKLRQINELKNIVPGDVLVHRDFYHHSILSRRDGTDLTILQGNGMNQQITEAKIKMSVLQGYYRIMDEDYV